MDMTSFNPEIVDDELSDLITSLVVERKPKTIIEIGSANGLGSTQAFAKGIMQAGIENECSLYCLEIVPERYKELVQNMSAYKFAIPVNASSVDMSEFMTEEQVCGFIDEHPDFGIAGYGEKTVCMWLSRDNELIKEHCIEAGWLNKQLAYNQIDKDSLLVLIDGSPFSGLQEFRAVYGADVIIMDDTIDIKCFDAYQSAMCSEEYELIQENPDLRNGYAAFRRKR